MTKDVKKEEPKNVVMKASTLNEMVISIEGKEGRTYKFTMPFFAPLPECYDAGVNVINEIARLYKEAIELGKKKAEEKEAAETKEVSEEKKDN